MEPRDVLTYSLGPCCQSDGLTGVSPGIPAGRTTVQSRDTEVRGHRFKVQPKAIRCFGYLCGSASKVKCLVYFISVFSLPY